MSNVWNIHSASMFKKRSKEKRLIKDSERMPHKDLVEYAALLNLQSINTTFSSLDILPPDQRCYSISGIYHVRADSPAGY